MLIKLPLPSLCSCMAAMYTICYAPWGKRTRQWKSGGESFPIDIQKEKMPFSMAPPRALYFSRKCIKRGAHCWVFSQNKKGRRSEEPEILACTHSHPHLGPQNTKKSVNLLSQVEMATRAGEARPVLGPIR